MFFGLEVKSNQQQAKPITLTKDLRLGQAVLDPRGASKKEPVSLVAEYNKKQFIISVLDPNHCWQAPLDLCFEAGSQVKFFIRGSGTVHLTGYDLPDDVDDTLYMSTDDDLEISNSDDEADLEPVKKRKMIESPKVAKSNGVKGSAKKNGIPVKSKPSADHENGRENDDDDDDSSVEDSMDDEDIDIDEDSSEDDSDLLDEEDDDDDDEDDEEEDEEDEDFE